MPVSLPSFDEREASSYGFLHDVVLAIENPFLVDVDNDDNK